MTGAGGVDPGNVPTIIELKSPSFFYLNARFINSKADNLDILLQSTRVKLDDIMLTKTWYNNEYMHYVMPYQHLALNLHAKSGGVFQFKLCPH